MLVFLHPWNHQVFASENIGVRYVGMLKDVEELPYIKDLLSQALKDYSTKGLRDRKNLIFFGGLRFGCSQITNKICLGTYHYTRQKSIFLILRSDIWAIWSQGRSRILLRIQDAGGKLWMEAPVLLIESVRQRLCLDSIWLRRRWFCQHWWKIGVRRANTVF